MIRVCLALLNSLLFCIPTSEAQLFKKLVDRTADKIAQRAEDKIVEGVSNELANRAMRPLDKAFDDIFSQFTGKLYNKTIAEDLNNSMLMEAKIKDRTKKKNNETKWYVTDINQEKLLTINSLKIRAKCSGN